MPLLFKALELVKPEDVKVVILGQDPTPQKGKATGVAFHVERPRFVPAVLHMFLEVAFEGFPVDLNYGDVTNWTRQGVLLLNAALTCPHNPPKGAKDKAKYKSHLNMWRKFTISLISYISYIGVKKAKPSVWLLWGEVANTFSGYINNKHLIIKGGHPSPMGIAIRGDSFFGGNYFNGANQFLSRNKRGVIDWSLSDTGWNSLKLIPENWGKQLRKEKTNIERELSKKIPLKKTRKIKKKRKPKSKLEYRLKQIDKQLQCIPYAQLQNHYMKMTRKIVEEIRSKKKVCV